MPDTNFSDWFVVRTQTNRERFAAENVHRVGEYQVYFPKVVERKRAILGGRRRLVFTTVPIFPGYIFARSPYGQWHALLNAFGVTGIISGSGGAPGVLRNSAILALQASEENGVIVLPKEQTTVRVRPGQNVRVESGAYSGFAGIVQGMASGQRIQILIDYMGRKVPFLVREVDVALVA